MDETIENKALNTSKPVFKPEHLEGKPDELKPRAPKPSIGANLDDPLRLTPEDRVRQALGLHHKDPIPPPEELSPQMRRVLNQLEPNLSHQVMAVMGGLEYLQEKTQAVSQSVQEKMEGNADRIKNVSMAQRTIIRRAEKGTIEQVDIERARSILQSTGAAGALDTKSAGLDELHQQRDEIMGAAGDMQSILRQQLPQFFHNNPSMEALLKFVDQSVGQQAAETSDAVNQVWDLSKNSDLERIALIVETQERIRQDAQINQSTTLGSSSP